MKINPLNGRLLVRSRGIKEECDGLIIPKHHLENSNICMTEDRKTIIKRIGSGLQVEDDFYILEPEDVLAEIVGKDIHPLNGMVLVRKCLDPEDDSGLITLADRQTRFAEILAVAPDSALKDDIGRLAYVDDMKSRPEKIEETQDDWLIPESIIEFVMGEDDE